MTPKHILTDLLVLIRQRYSDWEDFAHPEFIADEIQDKQASVAKAYDQINQAELDRLIVEGKFDECLTRLERLTYGNNLLWRRVPSAGDTAVLSHPNLDKIEFCTQVRNLLYGDRPSPERLQSFSEYLTANALPNGWPFPTYLLFLVHPDTELFVKPRTAHWFLQYMGETAVTVTAPPTAETYRLLLHHANQLRTELASFGAQNMVDIQSFIWVCFRVSTAKTGGLTTKAQIDLDIPQSISSSPLTYDITTKELIVRETPTDNPSYTLQECSDQTGYAQDDLARWVRAIQRKKQVIFYGPPGTGKTFIAQKLAQHLIGGNDGLMELVQFHPAYAYEDFIQGIRPVTVDGQVQYVLQNGRFLDFCQRAQTRQGTSVFLIDELNRANIAGVFGELMYLLEYRHQSIPLAGGGHFAIPMNVVILATMNTADRSIALVDHALRRRFAFIHLEPNFEVLRHYHQETDFPIAELITVLQNVNAQIHNPHYAIGHSFFMHPHLTQQLPDIWQMEIEPYLEEYFFNQPDRVAPFRWQQIAHHLLP